jgi:RNA polymerase sigma-70 factor (ECF subfamily)
VEAGVAAADSQGEIELVRRAQAGDREAFGLLAEQHQRTLFRFLFGMVADHHAAEELTQEMLLRVFPRIRDLENPAGALVWLLAIGRNLGRKWLRRRRRVIPLDPETPAPGPDRRKDERLADVLEALRRLKPADREVLMLCEVEGLPHSDVAAITGQTETALRSRLMRARRRLQALLGGP